MWRKLLKVLETKRTSKNRRTPKTRRLFLEPLEDRFLPAPVISTWTGGGGANNPNWSAPANWSAGVPQAAGDEATFDGAVNNCTVNIAVTLDKLTITNNYTGTITLNQKLTVGKQNVTSTMDGGTIVGGSQFIVAAGIFNWTGGTLTRTGVNNI